MKPMTVKQVSELTGVSVRTLQYYDRIGLLEPAKRTEAGYRLYTEDQLSRLQEILLFRELEFPLKDIKRIMASSNYDRELALRQQVELLTLKKEHLEGLIELANNLQKKGEKAMDFKAFDHNKLEKYAAEAKALYGGTDAYREFEEKSTGRTPTEEAALGEGLMEVFEEFGALLKAGEEITSPTAQKLVQKLQEYITKHFYNCTPEILSGLGKLYAADGEFKENIDARGGKGTAMYAAYAIAHYCK